MIIMRQIDPIHQRLDNAIHRKVVGCFGFASNPIRTLITVPHEGLEAVRILMKYLIYTRERSGSLLSEYIIKHYLYN